jgi:hypothetical protein
VQVARVEQREVARVRRRVVHESEHVALVLVRVRVRVQVRGRVRGRVRVRVGVSRTRR